MRDPKLLLLDEATAALDAVNEREVQEAIDNIALDSNRITITIAHRLKTVEQCDTIYVIGHGVVCERGTHDELLGRHEGYRQTYEHQVVEQQLLELEK